MLFRDYLVIHRYISLSLTLIILLLSLFEYSQRSEPVYVHERNTALLINQVILDRRLISTLVTSLVSLLCPVLMMLVPSEDSKTDKLGQVILSLGLALGWIISIQLDLKTNLDNLLAHYLKYPLLFFFLVEPVVTVLSEERKLELFNDEKI